MENPSSSNSGSIFAPSKLAFVIGGIAGFIACPLTGVWAVGTAVASGLAAGYGARWASKIGEVAGLIGGGIADLAASNGEPCFALILALAGGIGFGTAGGVAAYHYTKVPIQQFFQQEMKSHTQSGQNGSTLRLPSRSGNSMITAPSATYKVG